MDAIAGEKGLLALLQARREYAALERSLDRARTENADLREMARRLREDPNAIEEQARRELGLIKPGEMLFIIKDVDKKPYGLAGLAALGVPSTVYPCLSQHL